MLCISSKIGLLLGNHETSRKMNNTNRLPVVDFGGVGVVRKLIAPLSVKRECHQAVITVDYLISLQLAQNVKIKIGAVSYSFQHP